MSEPAILKGLKSFVTAVAHFFLEFSCLTSFFFKIPWERKRIIFYSEHEGYYPYYEGIINELLIKHNKEFCYITSSFSDSILQNHDPRISVFYLRKVLFLFMLFVDSSAFVITMTDLDNFHIKRSLRPVKYVYVFHSLTSTHMGFLEGAHDNYDVILCAGPHHKAEIRRREALQGLDEKELVEGGYFRLERIYSKYRSHLTTRLSDGLKTVLLAPGWGEKHILKVCGISLIKMLLGADFRVVVRPHPETIIRESELIGGIEEVFRGVPNFLLEKSVVTDDSLLEAEVLISDYSGVALEYALGTERPVLFIDTPPKIRNSKFGDLGMVPLELRLRNVLGKVISPAEISAAPSVIRKLIDDRDVYRTRIVEERKKWIYAFGHSSEIGAKCILKVAKDCDNC